MPNHITNCLIIIGTQEQIDEVLEFIKIEKVTEDQTIFGKGTIDFNKITPMPPWVYEGPLGIEEEEKYGEENCWFEWCCENWGTKWNAYYQPDKRNTENKLYFTTAWDCPIDLIKKLSWIFSEVELELSWADESIGENLGRVKYKDGEVLEEYHPEEGTKEAIEFFFDVTQKPMEDYDLDEYEYRSINLLAEKYQITIRKQELDEFKEFLYINPLLAYKNDVGQKIFCALKKHFEAGDYYTLWKCKHIYRGRIRKIDDSKYNAENLWNPPEGIAAHGRYNSIGISVLYCCDDMECIPYELYPTFNEVVDVATFQVNQDLKLLDIGELFRGFEGFFSEINAESKLLKKSYLLTNFIRDCCVLIGYNGVVYEGVRRDDANYALFNFEKIKDLEIVRCSTMYLDIDYDIQRIDENE